MSENKERAVRALDLIAEAFSSDEAASAEINRRLGITPEQLQASTEKNVAFLEALIEKHRRDHEITP